MVPVQYLYNMKWKRKCKIKSLVVFGSPIIIFIIYIWKEINGYQVSNQDDPDLIAFVKEKLINPPSNERYKLKHPKRSDFSQFKEGPFLVEYFNSKKNGTFIEAGAYDGEQFSNTLNLERTFGWSGLLIEPHPLKYKSLVDKNRKSHHINCCLSLIPRPSKSYLRLYGSKTNVIKDPSESKDAEVSYIDCYPLYTLMAATNLTIIDLLSLDVEGVEMKILKTIPWNKVSIKTILVENDLIPEGKEYLKNYIEEKGYEMYKQINRNYFFVKK